jgi:hypothetical protein
MQKEYRTKALPNFFVVGAPKAGTTSLYYYLDQHPDIYMSPLKEPNYFAAEIRPDNLCEELQEQTSRDLKALQEYLKGPMSEKRFGGLVSDWDDYLKLFQNVRTEKAIGEASVCYLWSTTAAEAIRTKIPDAKIIMILRDPADRAFSQYLENLASGRILNSFREQIQSSVVCKDKKLRAMHPFLELGLYHDQVKRFLERFPKERVRVLLYDEVQAQQTQSLVNIFRFLNVDSTFEPDTSRKYLEPRIPRSVATNRFLQRSGVWQHVRALIPRDLEPQLRNLIFRRRSSLLMNSEDRQFLVDYYKEDILKLSGILGRDVTAWLH